MTRALFLAMGLGLTGCAQLSAATSATTAVSVSVSAAQDRLQAAIDLYGIAKGIAEVAAVADPSLAPALVTLTATVDPQVARAQAILTAGTVDVAAIQALAATISAQANALELQAAPVIKVVPSAPFKPPGRPEPSAPPPSAAS